MLRVKNVTKEFFGVKVLDSVTLSLRSGEILGIIGENGSGKSTLLNIVAGIHAPSSGSIELEGREVRIADPAAAQVLGIALIPQECNLAEDLNVSENVFLGRELRRGMLLDKRTMRTRARELLDRFKTDISPTEKIGHLSIAQKRMVEFAKALSAKPRILVMDEPAAALSAEEIGPLFDVIREIKAGGGGVLYISHNLREVEAICDRVGVLRDGALVSVDRAEDLDVHEMTTRMAGRAPSQVFPDKMEPYSETVLDVSGLEVEGAATDVSFDLRKGEILGFAGLAGSGRTAIAEALVGLRPKKAGIIRIRNNVVDIDSPKQAIRNGFSYLSEDRQGKGILLASGIVHNVTLGSLAHYCCGGFIDQDKEYLRAEEYVEELGIRAASLFSPLEFFSGGNQQKVSLAKSLDMNPTILIADEPARGIDVNAKREIYRFIKRLTDRGLSCIFISSEVEELAGMCHRVVVLQRGRVGTVLEGKALNKEKIVFCVSGFGGAQNTTAE